MRRRGREFLMNTSQRRGVNLELVTDSPQGHKSQKPPSEGWFLWTRFYIYTPILQFSSMSKHKKMI